MLVLYFLQLQPFFVLAEEKERFKQLLAVVNMAVRSIILSFMNRKKKQDQNNCSGVTKQILKSGVM